MIIWSSRTGNKVQNGSDAQRSCMGRELLKPENKNKNNAGNHRNGSVFTKPLPLEKMEKPGLLKRFLDWIAKGADKSNMGKASCPT